jgi:hypothetical protein
MSCGGITKTGKPCSRTPKANGLCWQHTPKDVSTVDGQGKEVKKKKSGLSGNRTIGDLTLFDEGKKNDAALWQAEYERVIDPKYKKGTRNYTVISTKCKGNYGATPPIFLIPRVRGESYKAIDIQGVDKDHVAYCPVSKGYSMQDLSSFTLGPIVGEGLCLVNAAFSKIVTVMHIEGGGVVDYKRKCFWRRAKKPTRTIEMVDDKHMFVDGVLYEKADWLRENENLWLEAWQVWSRSIALCSNGDFHWTDDTPTISFRHKEKYISFVDWKKQCYIGPSYELLPDIKAFQYLKQVREELGYPLGLVHPKAKSDNAEEPITEELLRQMYDGDEMVCQPYVVAGKLLNVPI